MNIPLIYEHLFYKYFVRRSVGQATILDNPLHNSNLCNVTFFFRSPLRVENSPDGCFVVPRWGGVIVYNYFEMDSPDYIGFKFPTKLDLDMEKISGKQGLFVN